MTPPGELAGSLSRGGPRSGARGSWREVAAWCLFDFANSAFTTVIVTTVFSVYFVSTVVPAGAVRGELLFSMATSVSLLISAALGPVLGAYASVYFVSTVVSAGGLRGELLFSIATAISLLISAALAPMLGAYADVRRAKRFLLIASSMVCILASAGLASVRPGDVLRALILFVAANVGFEIGYVFYNGFLPEIVPGERAGRVSGYGWAIGYIGGAFSLVAALIVLWLQGPGIEAAARGARLTFLLVAAHFAVFALPAFLILRDRGPAPAGGFDLAEPFRRVVGTIRQLGRYREAFKFVLANLIYNDGVVTIFFFAGIYMDRALHFTQTEIIAVVLVLNLPSAIGSLGFGILSDRVGAKRTILITLVILTVTVALMAMTAPGNPASEPEIARARIWFWVLAMIAGLGIGANQSASRGLMARLIPAEKHAEFFGFFIFSGKLSSVFAPLVYGLSTQLTGDSRLAILSVAVFLLAGTGVLLTVDEQKGIRDAG